MKYLVYAIYPNLGIHVRVTEYETEEERKKNLGPIYDDVQNQVNLLYGGG